MPVPYARNKLGFYYSHVLLIRFGGDGNKLASNLGRWVFWKMRNWLPAIGTQIAARFSFPRSLAALDDKDPAVGLGIVYPGVTKQNTIHRRFEQQRPKTPQAFSRSCRRSAVHAQPSVPRRPQHLLCRFSALPHIDSQADAPSPPPDHHKQHAVSSLSLLMRFLAPSSFDNAFLPQGRSPRHPVGTSASLAAATLLPTPIPRVRSALAPSAVLELQDFVQSG